MSYEIVKKGDSEIIKGDGLYAYTVYIGSHDIKLEEGDSCWIIEPFNDRVIVKSGPCSITSPTLCTVIRGYACGNKTSDYTNGTNLPYINGCSSEQLFPPVRLGDPTLQMLYIPEYASEQQHHIHSTARVVYVLEGKGKSFMGMGNEEIIDLNKGDVLILDKMVPHHFETRDNSLTVLPLHVYSSQSNEHNHPMFNGTFKT